MPRGDSAIFRKSTITFRAKEPRLFQHLSAGLNQARLDQNALAHTGGVNAIAYCRNVTAGINTLNAGETERLARPTGIIGVIVTFRIPPDTRVDICIIHTGSRDTDQDFSSHRFWTRQIFAPLQAFRPAVADQRDTTHRLIRHS